MKGLMLFSALISAGATAGEFSPSADAVSGCPADFFTQKAVVFDAVTLCATSAVPKDKLVHAAGVAAQWLDNDMDGQVDEPALLTHLKRNKATLVMSKSGFSESAFDRMDMDGLIGQDLAANETNPAHRRDASQEEIHHLIVNAGWQSLYPKVFSDQPGSKLYKQWQLAEANGYYAYDDPTCDSSCKTVEFFYLSTAAYLGSASDLSSDEMRVKTRQSLKANLPSVVALMESDQYHYPLTRWPDGKYLHAQYISW